MVFDDALQDRQPVKFNIGEVIHHRLFHYRGVIVDVDLDFQASDKWYDVVALSQPPKDRPWYHVLVHEQTQATYVAEQNLEHDNTQQPIEHPMLSQFFGEFDQGHYVRNHVLN